MVRSFVVLVGGNLVVGECLLVVGRIVVMGIRVVGFMVSVGFCLCVVCLVGSSVG